MNFRSKVLKPGFLTLVIALLSTSLLVFLASAYFGEARLGDAIALNQWLARDVASQFSGQASRNLAQAQKFGALVRAETGGFDVSAQREFDADIGLKAVWVLDATGSGPLQPIARMERPGFTLQPAQAEIVRRLTDLAIQSGASARGLSSGLSAIAVKLGDLPRTILVFTDESFFSRASGGPWGDKWFLISPSHDQTEAVLAEATSELRADVTYPDFSEIARLIVAETPAQERTEFSSEIDSNGRSFQISGVQTGAFGVMAVAITPLEESFGPLETLFKIAFGIALGVSLLVMLFQALRARFGGRPSGGSSVDLTSQAESAASTLIEP